MSLTADEQKRTSEELLTNFRLSGLPAATVAADLSLTTEELDATLCLGPSAHPTEVWLVRDYLEQAILAAGGTPAPFTILTPEARRSAERWFTLRPAPRVSRH